MARSEPCRFGVSTVRALSRSHALPINHSGVPLLVVFDGVHIS